MSVLDVITGLLVYDTAKKGLTKWREFKNSPEYTEELNKWRDLKNNFGDIVDNNNDQQNDQNGVAKNGLSLSAPADIIVPKQQPGLTPIIDTNGFIPKVEKRSSHVHSNRIPMNTEFVAGGWNVRNPNDVVDQKPIPGRIGQFSFVTPKNIKSNKHAALCIELYGDNRDDIEKSVYKKCGFDDVEDYKASCPGKYDNESIQILKKLNTISNTFIKTDSDDKFENITARGIGRYDNSTQDSYDQFVANLVSGETQIFAAPTVEEVRKSYEKNLEVRSRIKYSDLWFCTDWKEDD